MIGVEVETELQEYTYFVSAEDRPAEAPARVFGRGLEDYQVLHMGEVLEMDPAIYGKHPRSNGTFTIAIARDRKSGGKWRVLIPGYMDVQVGPPESRQNARKRAATLFHAITARNGRRIMAQGRYHYPEFWYWKDQRVTGGAPAM